MLHNFQTDNYSSNHLLSSLPAADRARLVPGLQAVQLSSGDEINQPTKSFEFAYFPTSSVVSLVCNMEDGASVEVAMAGNDGLLGTALFLGGDATSYHAIVSMGGEAMRMEGSVLKDQFTRGGVFQRVLLRYTASLITQISLTAACNRKHPLEKRLCRWLLLVRDRVASDDLMITQEFIASILGARRETVTVAVGHLQDAGMIRYSRGRLQIVDRRLLEAAVCECYHAVCAGCNGDSLPTREYASECTRSSARKWPHGVLPIDRIGWLDP
jgi:CRP-like cAMP-binding protein